MGRLSARILALALGLVLLTSLAAGLATVQSARASARTEQRAELVAQASLVALQPGRLATARGVRRLASGLDGTTLTVVGEGAVLERTSAPGRPALLAATRSAATEALGGSAVSTAVRLEGREVLVEARPTRGGAFVLTRPVTAFTRTTADLVGRILVVLVVGLAVAAAAAIWLSRRIARPLQATASAARRMAHGERRVDVPEGAPGEVGDVADALRALDGALGTSEGRQREFLLSISHELRTPLTALRGWGEALADGLVTGDRVQEVGRTLTAESHRIERFTADLLELARLEADDFSIVPAEVRLSDVARSTAEAWRARAEQAGVALTVRGSDDDAVVLGDARRVRQVLDGLVENALRATPAAGAVTLLPTTGAGVRGIAVEDTGPGLSEEDLANAFTRGLLRERYRETRAVGTGLGLSIAIRLAARMGGRVVAGRAASGSGARFTLELPVVRPAP